MNEKYNLKKFIGMGSRKGDYFISFNKSGFLISSDFCSKENVKNFSRVFLYFDEEKKAVGFQLTNENNTEGAFALIHGNNGTTGSISARSFIKANNLDNSKFFGRKLPKKIIHEGVGDIFVIDLIAPDDSTDKSDQNTVEQLPEAVG